MNSLTLDAKSYNFCIQGTKWEITHSDTFMDNHFGDMLVTHIEVNDSPRDTQSCYWLIKEESKWMHKNYIICLVLLYQIVLHLKRYETWGNQHMLTIAMEENAELIQAISKSNAMDWTQSMLHIWMKTADVLICICELFVMGYLDVHEMLKS